MKTWLKLGGGTAAGAATAALVALAGGTLLWNRATSRAVRRLDSLAGAAGVRRNAVFEPRRLEGLPPPVVRYFQFALTPGLPLVLRARIRHQGEFWTKPGGTASPFRSLQHFAASPPGFVWDADIRMAPMLHARVRDSYLNGEGAMLGRLGGVVPIVNQRGTPSIAAGALVRWLAEAVWFPTALLPGPAVSWSAIDDSTARVTLRDGRNTVWLDAHFGERGEIARVSTMRDRDVNGVGVPTPWSAVHLDYQRVHGMMIPMAGEVTWSLPEGPYLYWRGRIREASYELAR